MKGEHLLRAVLFCACYLCSVGPHAQNTSKRDCSFLSLEVLRRLQIYQEPSFSASVKPLQSNRAICSAVRDTLLFLWNAGKICAKQIHTGRRNGEKKRMRVKPQARGHGSTPCPWVQETFTPSPRIGAYDRSRLQQRRRLKTSLIAYGANASRVPRFPCKTGHGFSSERCLVSRTRLDATKAKFVTSATADLRGAREHGMSGCLPLLENSPCFCSPLSCCDGYQCVLFPSACAGSVPHDGARFHWAD